MPLIGMYAEHTGGIEMDYEKLRNEDYKLSIIIPVYNVEKYVKRCLDSIIRQSYHNLEILVVNDGSTDGSKEIVEQMQKKDKRIIILEHHKNLGLFQARMTGVEAATGDYIGFVDSDDYVSMDFYRGLIYRAVEAKADIVVGKVTYEDESGYKYIHNVYDSYEFGTKEGIDILQSYWQQQGQCFIWHTIWNKIYDKKIWEKALPVLRKQKKHLVMCEDFLFSSIIFNYSKRLVGCRYGCYFYFQNAGASTSLNGNREKFKKNINDLIEAFRFVRYMVNRKDYNYDAVYYLDRWEALYKYYWYQNVFNSTLKESDKARLIKLLDNGLEKKEISANPDFFYSVTSAYDNRYNDIVDKIASPDIKYISFDVFDTALLRPFYSPDDLFKMLEGEFRSLAPDERRSFSDIRKRAEESARKEKIYETDHPLEEISLDDIYKKIKQYTSLTQEQLHRMKNCEIKAELVYCYKRKSIFNLYLAALHLNKKVIFISDIYLGNDVMEKLLTKEGYTFSALFVSEALGASKRTGSIYDQVVTALKINAYEMIHIGDDWEADIIQAKKRKIESIFYPKPIDCILYNISDIKTTHSCGPYKEAGANMINFEKALEFLGNRCALAVAANKLYDQPFISYHEGSEMNASPQFAGYYALGMHLLGFTKWLADDILKKNYEEAVFIARDGYLPMKAYKIVQEYCTGLPEGKYFYTSRKAGMPCGIHHWNEIYGLYDAIAFAECTLNDFIRMLEPVLDLNKMADCNLTKEDLEGKICDYDEFCYHVKNDIARLFDEEKAWNYNKAVSGYFNGIFSGKSVLIDIGYSGRTQEVIYRTCGKKVDAYYVHINEDKCLEREHKCGFHIKSYYDFTPAITGAMRELLFSSLEPSCVGYKIDDGKVICPILETDEYNYAKYYVINELHNKALEFIRDFYMVFGNKSNVMEYRNMEISYPFEYYLSCLTDVDLKLYDCCTFEDDLWAGNSFVLSEQWKKNIDYHRISPYYKQKQPVLNVEQNCQDTNYAWQLYNQKNMEYKSKVQQGIFWLVNDRDMFVKRLKVYLGLAGEEK